MYLRYGGGGELFDLPPLGLKDTMEYMYRLWFLLNKPSTAQYSLEFEGVITKNDKYIVFK